MKPKSKTAIVEILMHSNALIKPMLFFQVKVFMIRMQEQLKYND